MDLHACGKEILIFANSKVVLLPYIITLCNNSLLQIVKLKLKFVYIIDT